MSRSTKKPFVKAPNDKKPYWRRLRRVKKYLLSIGKEIPADQTIIDDRDYGGQNIESSNPKDKIRK